MLYLCLLFGGLKQSCFSTLLEPWPHCVTNYFSAWFSDLCKLCFDIFQVALKSLSRAMVGWTGGIQFDLTRNGCGSLFFPIPAHYLREKFGLWEKKYYESDNAALPQKPHGELVPVCLYLYPHFIVTYQISRQ